MLMVRDQDGGGGGRLYMYERIFTFVIGRASRSVAMVVMLRWS